ncbi:DNA helicase HerA-like ATPase [Ancylobacter sp. 3268]|uniref:helicase HerA-like domain-containing protein n=1 Tax=Ancylobacter sp. 3268 TaxID=2817752 RepID=UPI00286178E8|nr:helicase HerA-like domain-containing protein [Ancylobacter sp. 3268]MDR6952755.1 DNA helicase HerA-like ATPase [Ancylobacter sp. 3268]
MTGDVDGKILVGRSGKPEYLTLKLANRHGLATGATGTGKTVTLQTLAEGFSRAGVPVFAADIKGDLSGVAMKGEGQEWILKRCAEIGVDYAADEFPVVFWDLFGEQGHPVRATVTEMGPLLLSRLMNLNDVQEGVLNVVFRVADEHGLLLLDLKDLRAMLAFVAENAAKLTTTYGNVSSATVGAIQRALLVLENQGADKFFGEPALKISDLMHVERRSGYGTINILAADRLMGSPQLYASFLLWLLSELFEALPEVGDPEKPKLVFFFDEAHLVFDEAPRALLQKIEQVVRLIRSKGVGVYFVTQNPLDVPETVLAQLGNRVQHALRAFTPRDQKAVKAAADTFRPNPALNTAQVITELGKGEALVSLLEGNGTPSIVERTLIVPPAGRVGPVTPQERAAIIAGSPFKGAYDEPLDRESAFETLAKRTEEAAAEAEADKAPPNAPAPTEAGAASGGGWLDDVLGGLFGSRSPRGRMSVGEQVTRQVAREVTNQVTKAILRNVLGGRSRTTRAVSASSTRSTGPGKASAGDDFAQIFDDFSGSRPGNRK